MSEIEIYVIFADKKGIMFSKACEYGIRATIYVAVQSMQNNRVSLKDIAKEIDSPIAFTAKILQLLARNNIVDSVKGPTGGFQISKNKLGALSLRHVVLAIDGDSVFKGCGLGFKVCNEKRPCPIHHKFKKVRDELQRTVGDTSIHELASELGIGLTYLKR